MPGYLAILDTETTSLSHNRRPWEVAIIRRDLAGIEPEQAITLQVADVDLTDADPASLRIGRFHKRHGINLQAAKWMTEAQAAHIVELWTRDAVIVGAVPSFDAETLAAMLRRHRLAPGWHHRLRCVETLASGHLRREVGGLKDAARALGVPVDEAVLHTAMGDARLALAIWDCIMGAKS